MTFITQDEVVEILKILETSHFNELRLETGNLKLFLSRKMPGCASSVEVYPEETPPARPVSKPEMPPAPPVESEAAEIESGLTPIRAPILGVFYVAPKPGAPPFVQPGAWVDPEDPVCIVEVMKLFNTVTAGVSGRLVRVCVPNGEMVEYGQVLFLVDESAVCEE